MGSEPPGVGEGRKSRGASLRGWAALLALAGLAAAGAVWGFAGNGMAFIGPCAHFVTTLTTSQRSYAPGQPVIVTLTQANDGPACTIPPQLCGPPQPQVSAYNSAGEDVWDYGAGKTSPLPGTCGADGPSVTWTAGSAATRELDWRQDECVQGTGLTPGQPNPDCPGTQRPAGRYRITGEFWWIDGPAGGHGPPASATITISGSSPAPRQSRSA